MSDCESEGGHALGLGKINKGVRVFAALFVFFGNCFEEEHYGFVLFAFAIMCHSYHSRCS